MLLRRSLRYLRLDKTVVNIPCSIIFLVPGFLYYYSHNLLIFNYFLTFKIFLLKVPMMALR
jgi:hypothetical protein